jgi:cyclic pyranopterin phosphate synthase
MTKMIDVSQKEATLRRAKARACAIMKKETLALIREKKIKKGDVLAVAEIAGIMAAKGTPSIIPLCHPLSLENVDIRFKLMDDRIEIEAECKLFGKTGPDMEALSAVSVAALTVYDMCKGYDKEMVITDICLLEKSGGRSGVFTRSENG